MAFLINNYFLLIKFKQLTFFNSQLELTSDVLKDINIKTISMKAKHGSTKSERKQFRLDLHKLDINNVVSILNKCTYVYIKPEVSNFL